MAWNRVYHNLVRLKFEIVSAQFKEGLVDAVGIFIVKIKVNDSKKKGGLFSLGSTGEPKERLIYLILSEEDHELTRVEIETEKREFDTSLEISEFLSLLHPQIK